MRLTRYSFLFSLVLQFSASWAQLTAPPQTYVLRFNGSQIASAPLASQLNLGNTFTMEVWVYVESAQPFAIIMGKPYDPRSSDPFMNYVLEISDDGKFEFVQTTGQPGSYRNLKAPTTVQLKKWIHVAGVLSSGMMRLFVNGAEVGNLASPGAPVSSTTIPYAVGAGATPTGMTNGFTGAIRQARVWGVALSAVEIQARASSTIGGNEAGLITCWPLDDGSGTTARSIGSTSMPLTLGTSSGASVPTWIKSEVLDSLDAFFQPTNFLVTSTLRGIQDAIPFDFDGDGDLDLIITDLWWPPTVPGTQLPIAVMRNGGNGNFTPVTDAWVDAIRFVHPRHWVITDVDKDGVNELVIVDHGTDTSPFPGDQSRILKRAANGILVEETSTRFPIINMFTHNVASGDINGDGAPEIYMCNVSGQGQIGPRFYINNGSGVFAVDSSRIPSIVSTLQQKYMSSALVDVDNDGDLDLVLGGHDGTGPSEYFPKDGLLLNNGSGTFTFAPDAAMPNRYGGPDWGTVAIAVADFNRDTWQDLLMVNQRLRGQLQLLLNNKNGTFTDYSNQLPTQEWPQGSFLGESWIKWAFPADFNGDGKIDLVAVGQGLSKPKLYMNSGDAKFVDKTEYTNFGNDVSAIAVADFTGDGRLDIVVVRYDRTATLLRNVKNMSVTAAEEDRIAGPSTFSLSNAYPNPFNPSTTMRFSVEKSGRALLRAFDLLGREIRTLFDGEAEAGRINQVIFDATGLATGIYIMRLESGGNTFTQKVVFIK